MRQRQEVQEVPRVVRALPNAPAGGCRATHCEHRRTKHGLAARKRERVEIVGAASSEQNGLAVGYISLDRSHPPTPRKASRPSFLYTTMENLRQGIGLQAFGQRDPLVMYKKEGRETFDNLQARIQHDISHTMFHIGFANNGSPGAQSARKSPPSVGTSVMTKVVNRSREAVPAGDRKIGRNEACPCGSGKKYKRCHG